MTAVNAIEVARDAAEAGEAQFDAWVASLGGYASRRGDAGSRAQPWLATTAWSPRPGWSWPR